MPLLLSYLARFTADAVMVAVKAVWSPVYDPESPMPYVAAVEVGR
jgi:hypothetical protein